jgi:hypothetical protein
MLVVTLQDSKDTKARQTPSPARPRVKLTKKLSIDRNDVLRRPPADAAHKPSRTGH